MSDSRAIGVFDSGIGGLTVLSKLVDMFPNESFIYVADTLNCPYGVKSPDKIRNLVTKVTNFLLSKDVKAIVIACNTATANSMHLKDFVKIPVIGVIDPTAKYAYKHSKNKKIAVLATNATIDSNQYQMRLNKFRLFNRNKKYFVKCSEFVTAIEAMEIKTETSYKIVSDKIDFLKDKNIDTVILGCTHFGLYESEIREVLPNAKQVECGLPTGLYLKEVLEKNGLNADSKNDGVINLYTTGSPEEMKKQIKWFDKEYQNIVRIKL